MKKSSSFFVLLLLVLGRFSHSAAEPLCPEGAEPRLVIETAQGSIVARLDETAAPAATRRVAELAGDGYYDGLTFIHAQPHIELATGERADGAPIDIPSELDGVALGLDRQRIENAGKAMDVAQQELAPAYKKHVRSGRMTPRLKEWMDRLYSQHDAGFLVGVSQLEVNEALGYVYTRGLDSRPVDRGALLLMPRSPGVASPRLGIALADMPQHTGRIVVLGQVVEGLDTAEAISIRPLADPGVVHDRHRPADPVRIGSIRYDCLLR